MTLIGIYTVDNHSDVHLIEMLFDDAPENVEVGEITQEIDGQLRDTWQAVYDEKYLDATGTTIIGDDIDLPKGELRTRLIFFFHFLDFKKPLLTPYGELKLTAPTAMPSRLAGKLEYEKP